MKNITDKRRCSNTVGAFRKVFFLSSLEREEEVGRFQPKMTKALQNLVRNWELFRMEFQEPVFLKFIPKIVCLLNIYYFFNLKQVFP